MKERVFVTDWFQEKLNDIIDEEFLDFQADHDIDDGGLPPELALKLSEAAGVLLDAMNECIGWQAAHASDMNA